MEENERKIGLNEFVETLIKHNEEGNMAVIEHKEKILFHKNKRKREKSGYHAPGTQNDCEICMKIFKSYEEIQKLEKECFGMVGIPVDSLISAIKVTKATIEMMRIDENGTN